MEGKCILLDTSFFIRLLNPNDPLHQNTLSFFRYFLENNNSLKCSTISVAEYCVRGTSDELPLKNLEILPFNFLHAEKAGQFANAVYANKNALDLSTRLIIPNDTNLFAQAQVEREIDYFATADKESLKIFDFLNQKLSLSFSIINIREPYHSVLGILPFES